MKVIKDYLEASKAAYEALGLSMYYNLDIMEEEKWNGNRDFVSWISEGEVTSEEVKNMIVSEKYVTFLVYGCMGDTYYIAFDKANKDEDLEE